MTGQTTLPVETTLRQFWLRCLLFAGLMWGILPLITLPFIFRGNADSALDVWAAVMNGLSISPACTLAFWHRRLACVWLSVNAAVLSTSITLFTFRNHDFRVANVIGACVSVLLAVLLDVTEARQWPAALNRPTPIN
jgi:hypothetical protein